MKIRELLIRGLMKTSLFEMAFSRAEAIKRATNLQFQIAEHVVKIFMYHESNDLSHWCDELNAWLKKIQRHKLKETNQPLSFDVLRQILWEQPLESIDEVQSYMNEISYEYPKTVINQPDAAVIHKLVEDLLFQVCLAVSQNKFRDIKNYLFLKTNY